VSLITPGPDPEHPASDAIRRQAASSFIVIRRPPIAASSV
jgi:hypothetical protein